MRAEEVLRNDQNANGTWVMGQYSNSRFEKTAGMFRLKEIGQNSSDPDK